MFLERLFYRTISPQRRFFHLPLYFILKVLSGIYFFGVCLRLWAYRSGLFHSRRLDCRVISVGNLTLGGTGKTPFVIMVAETLRGNGRRPAILSRGYGGRSIAPVNVVCDGERILMSPEEAGDEPVMMAQRLKNVPILTGPERFVTGRYAMDHFEIDTLVLDDGFQHLALCRDLDILLLDHNRPFGNGNLFPAGELREPLREARRADKVCITRYSGNQPTRGIDSRLLGNIPIMRTGLRLDAMVAMGTGEVRDPEFVGGKKIAAFCGIARPEDFIQVLEDKRARVVWWRGFPDHHVYSPSDLKAIEKEARAAGAELVVTTEKDGVKVESGWMAQLPLYKAAIDLEILEGREAFNRDLLN
ncbi:MAG: tetraacyldisaccharide 4'-kinase [Nitrospinae bacterium CG11_big_fil_rev_8_21_14_0_20_56_8]|nr:MAG: tetraacyldisaccharide 4'-kinase [Nitrospinae bacterium CG11_big_fil_rev_8_21_14_0_20_56_8]